MTDRPAYRNTMSYLLEINKHGNWHERQFYSGLPFRGLTGKEEEDNQKVARFKKFFLGIDLPILLQEV